MNIFYQLSIQNVGNGDVAFKSKEAYMDIRPQGNPPKCTVNLTRGIKLKIGPNDEANYAEKARGYKIKQKDFVVDFSLLDTFAKNHGCDKIPVAYYDDASKSLFINNVANRYVTADIASNAKVFGSSNAKLTDTQIKAIEARVLVDCFYQWAKQRGISLSGFFSGASASMATTTKYEKHHSSYCPSHEDGRRSMAFGRRTGT